MTSPRKQSGIKKMLSVAIFLMVLTAAIATSNPAIAATLQILNESPPSATAVTVIRDDPVLVFYEVSPNEKSSPLDVIQLRRIEDDQIVSYQARGEGLSGTVELGTLDSLGLMRVVYVLFSDNPNNIIATADKYVRVVSEIPGNAPREVRYPARGIPSLQAAIDAVADNGTVTIRPGVYREPVLIVGKTVNLVGSGTKGKKRTAIIGPRPMWVDPLSDTSGLVRYGPGGGGVIKHLVLSGGDAGIVGAAQDISTPAPIKAQNVIIENGALGIVGNFGELKLKNTIVRGTLAEGIFLSHIRDVDIADGWITNIRGVALPILNYDDSAGAIKISNTLFTDHDGGILIVGNGKPVTITDSAIAYGRYFGIFLFEAGQVELQQVTVTHIEEYEHPTEGGIADGLMALYSTDVAVVNSWFKFCARSGITYVGSGGEIRASTSQFNDYGAVIQEDPKPYVMEDVVLSQNNEANLQIDGGLPTPDVPPIPDASP